MEQVRYVIVVDRPDEWSLDELENYLRHLTPLITAVSRDESGPPPRDAACS